MCWFDGVKLSMCLCSFFFQAEDGIRDLVRSRGLGDVYKRQPLGSPAAIASAIFSASARLMSPTSVMLALAAV